MKNYLQILACTGCLSIFGAQATLMVPTSTIQSTAYTHALNSTSSSMISNNTSIVAAQSVGTLIWSKNGINYTMATAQSSATAMTAMGVNKVAVQATEVAPVRPSNLSDYGGWEYDRSAWATAQASSLWNDWFYVGGTPGRGLQVTARGYVEFSSAFTALGTKSVPWEISFWSGGSSKYMWGTRNYGSYEPTAIPNVLSWEHTFNVTTGQWFEYGNMLALYVGSPGGYLNHMDWDNETQRLISASIDSMHTSVLSGFEVSDGSLLQNSTNDLVTVDGKYTYQASVREGLTPGNTVAVSAPSSWLLSTLALALLFMQRRRMQTK